MTSNEEMIDGSWIGKDGEGSGRGRILRYHPNFLVEDWGKHIKVSRDSWSPGRYLNLGSPEYETPFDRHCWITRLRRMHLDIYKTSMPEDSQAVSFLLSY
jgi:hypothetical protein